MSFLDAFGAALAAALLGGASAGLLGVLVVGLRLPFLAVAAAHAALAGAVFADLLGAPHLAGAFLGALAGALVLGALLRRRDLDPNAALGALFSLTLGLAFLGVGMGRGPKTAALSLMWGSLLFATRLQLAAMTIVAAALLFFVIVFRRELKLLLFSRQLAALLIPEGPFFAGFLVLASGVVAVDLEIVGGLLLYSLLANPAVASLALARSFRGALILGAAFGAASALLGFAAAYFLDAPVGATIVLASSALVGAAWLVAKARRDGR